MADLQRDRIGGGGEPVPFPATNEEPRFDHVAVGYTNRATLDDFIGGEAGDLVVRGPFHTGESVEELRTLGSSVTQGTPCLVVPLIHERMTEIQREVDAAIDAFQSRWEPEPEAEQGAAPIQQRGTIRGGHRAARKGSPPHTYGETGGTARGTSSGAIRKGSTGPNAD